VVAVLNTIYLKSFCFQGTVVAVMEPCVLSTKPLLQRCSHALYLRRFCIRGSLVCELLDLLLHGGLVARAVALDGRVGITHDLWVHLCISKRVLHIEFQTLNLCISNFEIHHSNFEIEGISHDLWVHLCISKEGITHCISNFEPVYFKL